SVADDVHPLWSFFFSSRRRHKSFSRDWSSDVCSSDLLSASPGVSNSPAQAASPASSAASASASAAARVRRERLMPPPAALAPRRDRKSVVEVKRVESAVGDRIAQSTETRRNMGHTYTA